jgi:hypothetical protein
MILSRQWANAIVLFLLVSTFQDRVADVDLACDFFLADSVIDEGEETLRHHGLLDLGCQFFVSFGPFMIDGEVGCCEFDEVNRLSGWLDRYEVVNFWE